MALNVDPAILADAAAKLAALARDTGAGLPNGWVLPAGADPISGAHVPRLNAQAASLFNGVRGILNEVQRHAHHIGGAAADYTATDDQNARVINNSGAEILANPVGDVQEFGFQQPPVFSLPAATGSVDPLTFAKQLHTGPGPGPATRFAGEIRQYTGGFHTAAAEGVDGAASVMQHWTPVGTTVSEHLTEHRNWLSQLGTELGALADNIDTYGNAFTVAKAKHPTPEEIIAARKRLLAAMKSKNELGIQEALAEFQEQNARSLEAITGYSTTVNSKLPTEGGTSDTGGGSGKGTGSGSGSGSDASSMLSSMLPAMMSAMSGLGQNQNTSSDLGLDDEYSDYGYDDLGIPSGLGSLGGSGAAGSPISGGIPDITGASTSMSVGAMPIVATSGAASNTPVGLPRTPVIDGMSSASSAAAAAARGAGNGMMPYMPMSPGMGGGGGGNSGERNRVVAWHPDRLMYVDDTPHTEQVIGERPTIAPTVTPPTPAQGGQSPTQSGGSM